MDKSKREKVVNKYVKEEIWKINYFHAGGKCYTPKSEEEHFEHLQNLNGDRINILQYFNKENGKFSGLKNELSPEEIQCPPYEIRIAISKRYKSPPKRKSLEFKASPKIQ